MKRFLIKYINKLYNVVNSTTKDSILHSYGSTISVLLFFGVFTLMSSNIYILLLGSCILTILLGVFKEYIIDLHLRKTQVEFQDIRANIFGTIIGSTLNIMLYLCI